jgi:hypothetical protein
MSHTTNEADEITDDFIDTIADGDYIFVLDSDGNLKSLLLPDDYEKQQAPEKIEQALKLFGVSAIEKQTLH